MRTSVAHAAFARLSLGPTTTWPGDLDDVRLYGRALTAREIRALAEQP